MHHNPHDLHLKSSSTLTILPKPCRWQHLGIHTLLKVRNPAFHSSHRGRSSSCIWSSHPLLLWHSSCRTHFPLNTNGATNPSGSYKVARTDRMLRCVPGLSFKFIWKLKALDSTVRATRFGLQCMLHWGWIWIEIITLNVCCFFQRMYTGKNFTHIWIKFMESQTSSPVQILCIINQFRGLFSCRHTGCPSSTQNLFKLIMLQLDILTCVAVPGIWDKS